MSNLSGVIQNGQTLTLKAGAGTISAGDLIQVGGPGNEAWSVITSDHAAMSAQQIVAPVSIVAGTANNYARWGVETDSRGNIYTATPNASGQGVAVAQYAPGGALLTGPVTIDSTAHTMVSIRLVTLSNNTFAAIYADSTTGGVRFTIFDTGLNIVAGPTAAATGYLSGAVAYSDACALSGGGFAVVYQNNGHTAINLQTYSNTGVAVLAATSIQAVSGAGALTYVRIGQLSTGNLVVAMRGTQAPAGTSFVIVTTGGVSVQTNVIVDSTATAGFLNLSIMPSGGFAVSCMDGTNVVAAVYNNAGTIQGSAYTSANTLNSTTYIQQKLTNDGLNFYFCYVQSAGGLAVIQLTTAGAVGTSATGLLSSTFTSTSSIDGSISNNVLVMLQASITTGGQKYVAIELPDSSLGISVPNVVGGPTTIGSAAATTGSYWPTIRAIGDFTALIVYDQQTTAATLFGMIKFAASSIQGIAQNSVAAGNPGSSVTVNPGAGSYPLPNGITGTNALAFDHSNVTPPGNKGVVFYQGVSLSNPGASSSTSINSPTGTLFLLAGGGVTRNFSYTATQPTKIWEQRNLSTSFSLTVTIAGAGAVPVSTFSVTNSQAGFYLLGAGQTITVTGNLTAGGDSITYYAEKDQ